jgi:peptidoglycan/LPS O-acetylase OafA/YrhL
MAFLHDFRRVTTKGRRYLPVIDGLRFVAIIAVIAYHIRGIVGYHFGYPREIDRWNPIDVAIGTGHMGVELFFTISGFILSLPFAEYYLAEGRKVSLRSYYVRRVTRLEPPYIIHLVFLVIFCWLVLRHQPAHDEVLGDDHWFKALMSHIIPSVFYSHALVFGEKPYPNIVLWSLESEVQFYLFAPVLAAVFAIRNLLFRRGTIVALLVGSSLAAYYAPQDFVRHVMLVGTLQFFLGGFLLTDFYVVKKERGPRTTHYAWDVVWWLGLAALAWCATSEYLIYASPWLIFAVCLGGMRGKGISKILEIPWITVIGGMCYTIYMYHWFAISALVRATGHIRTGWPTSDYLLQISLMTLPILGISALLFLVSEKPFMRPDWHLRLWNWIRERIR